MNPEELKRRQQFKILMSVWLKIRNIPKKDFIEKLSYEDMVGLTSHAKRILRKLE